MMQNSNEKIIYYVPTTRTFNSSNIWSTFVYDLSQSTSWIEDHAHNN